MNNNLASWTAHYVSLTRAAHQILDGLPKIIDDPIVVGLTIGSSVSEIFEKAEEFQSPIKNLARSLFILRSRFAEDKLKDSVERGIKHYVMLGAGLETFAYRQPQWAEQIKIIELDHPASQKLKRECLAGHQIDVPNNVTFCCVDFEKTTLDDALNNVNMDHHAPTFFSWLGVTQYLSAEAFYDMLKAFLRFPKGSAVVFSFVLVDELLDGLNLEAAQFFARKVAENGEPWLMRFTPSRLQEQLYQLGFAKVEHLRPQDIEQLYLAGRSDQLTAPIFEQFMYIEV